MHVHPVVSGAQERCVHVHPVVSCQALLRSRSCDHVEASNKPAQPWALAFSEQSDVSLVATETAGWQVWALASGRTLARLPLQDA